MIYKSIFNAVAVVVVMVALILGVSVSAQTKNTTTKVDSRFVGDWSFRDDDRSCFGVSFKADGTGYTFTGCHIGAGFKFTVSNNRIKFYFNGGCDEEGNCWDAGVSEFDFSFSDGGKTLILGDKKYKNENICC